jgi:hypothetical protein
LSDSVVVREGPTANADEHLKGRIYLLQIRCLCEKGGGCV